MIKIVAISASIAVTVVGGYYLYNYIIQQNKKTAELEKTKFHRERSMKYILSIQKKD